MSRLIRICIDKIIDNLAKIVYTNMYRQDKATESGKEVSRPSIPKLALKDSTQC